MRHALKARSHRLITRICFRILKRIPPLEKGSTCRPGWLARLVKKPDVSVDLLQQALRRSPDTLAPFHGRDTLALRDVCMTICAHCMLVSQLSLQRDVAQSSPCYTDKAITR